jgi:DNA-binding NarL/FixJ family response regulator
MSLTDERAVTLLLVEDDRFYVEFVTRLLGGAEMRLESVDRLSAAFERLSANPVDVVILDLGLPDSWGLETFNRLHAYAPQVPVIVLTASENVELAREVIRQGAQDYLVKGDVKPSELRRSITTAIERQQYRRRLERDVERLQRQLHYDVSGGGASGCCEEAPLRLVRPDLFEEYRARYARLLDLSLEQQAYKINHQTSGDLREIGESLGALAARPRDVLDIHTAVMRERARGSQSARLQAYVSESRLLLVELMGHLSMVYRRQALVPRGRPSARPGAAGCESRIGSASAWSAGDGA